MLPLSFSSLQVQNKKNSSYGDVVTLAPRLFVVLSIKAPMISIFILTMRHYTITELDHTIIRCQMSLQSYQHHHHPSSDVVSVVKSWGAHTKLHIKLFYVCSLLAKLALVPTPAVLTKETNVTRLCSARGLRDHPSLSFTVLNNEGM